MDTKRFNTLLQKQFDKMQTTGKLFKSSITGNEVWDKYINSFKPEDDPVFRDPDSSSHNCNLCKNFMRRYGNVVSMDENYYIMTIFDIEDAGEYNYITQALSELLMSAPIEDVFYETYDSLNSLPYEKINKRQSRFQLGTEKNVKRYTEEEANKFGGVEPGKVYTFNHYHLFLNKEFVDKSGSSIESIAGTHRDRKNVFKRAMDEIPLDTLILVKDLINQGSLLDGQTHLHKIDKFISLKKQYGKLPIELRDNWCWVASHNLTIAKFRNEVIGTLCVDLAEGMELNKACQSWNKKVDPANYMKATAPITKKQIEEAKKFVQENGYEESFDRRLATIDDIKASEILHLNSGDAKLKSVSVFDNVKPTSTRHKKSEFDKIESIHIDKFMKDILPSCTSIEAYLENRMENNLCVLTTANNPDSKPIFKWDNNYSWTFNGNLAGKSQIKENVKDAGGKVDGVLRFSIMWAENDGDNSDLDAHCVEPNGFRIFYRNKYSSRTGGNLDIDITRPQSQRPKGAVENIIYPSLLNMVEGKYKFIVKQFSGRNSKGFKAEIEFNGETYYYEYNKKVTGYVDVATVELKNGTFSITHHLPESNSNKELWGLEMNNFHKVNLISLTPNHWGNNNVGNKHYLFMLNGCKTDGDVRSFHNENLIPELIKHRRVMEVLGSTNMIQPTNKHLAGLGFNATVRDELIVKVQGSHKRVVKIIF